MSIYVYAPRVTPGTLELIEALGAKRLVKHDGMRFLSKGTPIEFSSVDVIICWGQHVPSIEGVLMFNASYKYPTQLQINRKMGIDCGNMDADAAVLALTAMSEKLYQLDLDRLIANHGKWKGNRPQSGYVPYEEFPGYGCHFYPFQTQNKQLIFRGKSLLKIDACPKEQKLALLAVERLKLDFAMVTTGMLDTTACVRKVITAPALNKAAAVHLAEHILAVVQDKQLPPVPIDLTSSF